MDYGGIDRRKTKKDLRRKRQARVFKRGGIHRGQEFTKKEGEQA